jgi:hypothetical protein
LQKQQLAKAGGWSFVTGCCDDAIAVLFCFVLLLLKPHIMFSLYTIWRGSQAGFQNLRNITPWQTKCR